MKERVDVNGSLSEPIPVDYGVKQGDIVAPILFSIFFAVMLSYAFQDTYLEPLENSSTFVVSTPSRHQFLVRELLFADDADLVAHTEEDMQLIMDIFSRVCIAFSLTINLKKTRVMYTQSIG